MRRPTRPCPRLAAPEKAPEPEKPSHKYSQQAALACDDARFRAFLDERYAPEADPFKTADEAAEAVRYICQVESRAKFDTDEAAASRWRRVHTEFLKWRKE